jgi:quercetin dioxygenase-like cupin family protein
MTIICPDLSEALEFFTIKLNFRLDMIMPADGPRVAVVSKDGESMRLEAETRPVGSASLIATGHTPYRSCFRLSDEPRILISRRDNGEWVKGRAGMEYRDLVPDRLGGKVVASHIRLTQGGEVADYVHYHKVAFQMIFCIAGAIRVVYEEQGEPFWLRPGDCVLQPPEIRHRVLEAEAGSEVIEIGCPAVHETWVDHEMRLPTKKFRPYLDFGGQQFVRHVAGSETTLTFPGTSHDCIRTGIAEATGGLADVVIWKFFGNLAGEETALAVSDHVYFFFVLEGRIQIESLNGELHQLSANDSLLLLSSGPFVPFARESCKLLAVKLPLAV